MTEAERLEWNAAVASGDPVEPLKDRLLNAIHTRIMNDDPNYRKAGWS